MIGRENDEVAWRARVEQAREPCVHFFQSFRVAFDIVAVAEVLIEIDEIYEDETISRVIHGRERLCHAVRV